MAATPSSPRCAGDDGDDRAWLRAAAAGQRGAFESLYRRHHPRLARFLRRFIARHDQIDDVINEAMWVVWRRAGDFRGESRASTWITGIAYRCMLKARRTGSDAADVEFDETRHTDLADAGSAHELRDWVASGLARLPEEQRTTLVLAYYMGESCEDIAAIMGCAVGTVKARLFHARVRLRNVLPALAGAAPGGRQAR